MEDNDDRDRHRAGWRQVDRSHAAYVVSPPSQRAERWKAYQLALRADGYRDKNAPDDTDTGDAWKGPDCQGESKRDIDGAVIGHRPYDGCIDRACTVCGAEPGEFCTVYRTGEIRDVPHVQRRYP